MPRVEEWVYLVMIAMIGSFSLIGVKMFKPNQGKTKVKTRNDHANDQLDRVNEETIDRLADQLKKEAGRANRLQALKDKQENNQELEEDQSKQVTFEEITALVKEGYPKYAPMLPLMKKQIMDITKGMSLEEILNYVKTFTGNKESKGQTDPQSAEYNPNWA